jgi:hypothetical protein
MNSAISRVSVPGCSSTMLWPQSGMPRRPVFARVVAISRPLAGIATRSCSPTITSIGAAPPYTQSSGGVELLALTWALARSEKCLARPRPSRDARFPGVHQCRVELRPLLRWRTRVHPPAIQRLGFLGGEDLAASSDEDYRRNSIRLVTGSSAHNPVAEGLDPGLPTLDELHLAWRRRVHGSRVASPIAPASMPKFSLFVPFSKSRRPLSKCPGGRARGSRSHSLPPGRTTRHGRIGSQ